MSLSSILLKGGSVASTAVISLLSSDPTFQTFSSSESQSIKTRDAEDGQMLNAGISKSIDEGVLSEGDRSKEGTTVIEVDGKTPEEVATIIMSSLPPPSPTLGRLVTIVGFSGVGKGTTVSELLTNLSSSRPPADSEKVLAWSNGNIFRSLTMLTSLHMEKEGLTDIKEVIEGEGSKELKASMMSMLSFTNNPTTNVLDTHITGYGVDYWVSSVQTTVLKGPLVSGKIPTVAKATQGEVVKFVKTAVGKLVSSGVDVVVEGREETVSFIDTPNRFELVMKDDGVIGQRRAAQRIVGEAVKRGVKEGMGDEEVERIVKDAMKELV